ncbi:MAG: glycosyltransferase family 39 protein [Candidatus Hydrogenedentes bacterium]|nr:glycosyltransferase family 39 protein [Candidatus Hydrogenedentota bacterium]
MSNTAPCEADASRVSDRFRGGGREWLLVFAVLLVALAFRCYRLADEPLWHDETASINYLDAPSFGDFVARERPGDPAMVPLYFYIEYRLWKLTGGSVIVLRVLSVVFGMMTVVITYATARRIFGPPAALVAAGCAAVAIQQVYYSQEIRMYALYGMAGALAMYALLRVLQDGAGGTTAPTVWWAVLGLANAVMLWTHLHGLWLVLVQGAFVFVVRRKDAKTLALWTAVNGPLLVSVFLWVSTTNPESVEAHLGWIPKLFSEDTKRYLADSALSINEAVPGSAAQPGAYLAADPPPRWDESLHLPTVAKILIGVLWITLTSTVTLRTLRKRRQLRACARVSEGDRAHAERLGTDLGLMLTWLVAPAAILIFLSLVWRPTFLPRYALPSTVALYVLMGGAVALMGTGRWQWVIGCLLVGLYAYDTTAFGLPRRPNLREAMTIVDGQPYTEGDMVLVHPSTNRGPARYYSGLPDSAIQSYGKWEDLPDKALEVANAGRHAWVLVGSQMGTPPDPGPGLRERGLNFEYKAVPGAFMLRVYHVMPNK